MSQLDDFAEVDFASLRPSQTAEDFVREAQFFHKMLPTALIGWEVNECFVYLVSEDWFGKWKTKVDYQRLLDGMQYGPENVKLHIELPQLNDNLVDHSFDQPHTDFKFLKPELENYSLFSVVTHKTLTEGFDYFAINEEAWKVLKILYPNAIEVRRLKYVDRSTHLSRIEVKFPMVAHLLADLLLLFPSVHTEARQRTGEVRVQEVRIPGIQADGSRRAEESAHRVREAGGRGRPAALDFRREQNQGIAIEAGRRFGGFQRRTEERVQVAVHLRGQSEGACRASAELFGPALDVQHPARRLGLDRRDQEPPGVQVPGGRRGAGGRRLVLDVQEPGPESAAVP